MGEESDAGDQTTESERCDHCGATFDDEEGYLRHLSTEHGDDLGPIEQRRVDSLRFDDDGPTIAMYGGAVGALAIGVLLAYLLFFSGGEAGGAGGPDDAGGTPDASGLTRPQAVGSVHYHGTIEATIGGQQLDFGRQRFQLQADAFHFENGEGRRWHVHAEEVTLAWAMQTLGIDVTNGTVSYRGTTYGDDPGETARVLVNGESVTPTEYVLQKGDRVRIVANASAGNSSSANASAANGSGSA
ncbi:C2H2-type zinc finger protein [Halorussus gelatinilyticus]|uniref:C2H2-type zinc finger protein n=1 Tax=Halorussus gelatinilyticus TaxID=2937524 RepID=A0A8U0IL43_9EURY|nr:C2H2-type zinc finger protein [Halorussus gelatinilyticus]UPW01375.1 C2H2-type zinc finger protein [Halorussus gelatinilyticus]